jgi:hypothetical protein
MRNKKWVRLLAYVTGSVNRELLLQNEYLAAENRILRAKLPTKLRLSNPERGTLAKIGKRLGRKVLAEALAGESACPTLSFCRGTKCATCPEMRFRRCAPILSRP